MTLHIPAPEPTSNYLGIQYVTYAGVDDLTEDDYLSWIKAAWDGHDKVIWRLLPEKKNKKWRCRFAVVDG